MFLLYLAYGAFSAYRDFVPDTAGRSLAPRSTSRQVLKAALINALGPGPWIFWGLIAGPIFLEGWRGAPLHGLGFLLGFYGTLIGGNLFFIPLFSSAQRLGSRLNREFIGLSALALLIFGVIQFYRGMASIF